MLAAGKTHESYVLPGKEMAFSWSGAKGGAGVRKKLMRNIQN